MFRFFIQLILLSIFLIFPSYSKNYEKIIIKGNERISNETILVFSEIKDNKSLDENSINEILKKLYKSGFFKDVTVKIENNNLTIDVLENPIIQTVFIEGIKRKKTEESLYEILSLKNRSSYNSTLIKKDEELILATQTTLSLDDTKALVDALQIHFTKIEFPKADDICYATQNRQDAVKELIRHCDHLLVIGSKNSSNTLRLVELAQKHSIPANLVSDPDQFDLEVMIPDLENKVIGISSGASAPERLIDILVSKLLGDPLYQNSRDFSNSDYAKNSLVEILSVIEEKTYFKLPADLQAN